MQSSKSRHNIFANTDHDRVSILNKVNSSKALKANEEADELPISSSSSTWSSPSSKSNGGQLPQIDFNVRQKLAVQDLTAKFAHKTKALTVASTLGALKNVKNKNKSTREKTFQHNGSQLFRIVENEVEENDDKLDNISLKSMDSERIAYIKKGLSLKNVEMDEEDRFFSDDNMKSFDDFEHNPDNTTQPDEKGNDSSEEDEDDDDDDEDDDDFDEEDELDINMYSKTDPKQFKSVLDAHQHFMKSSKVKSHFHTLRKLKKKNLPTSKTIEEGNKAKNQLAGLTPISESKVKKKKKEGGDGGGDKKKKKGPNKTALTQLKEQSYMFLTSLGDTVKQNWNSLVNKNNEEEELLKKYNNSNVITFKAPLESNNTPIVRHAMTTKTFTRINNTNSMSATALLRSINKNQGIDDTDENHSHHATSFSPYKNNSNATELQNFTGDSRAMLKNMDMIMSSVLFMPKEHKLALPKPKPPEALTLQNVLGQELLMQANIPDNEQIPEEEYLRLLHGEQEQKEEEKVPAPPEESPTTYNNYEGYTNNNDNDSYYTADSYNQYQVQYGEGGGTEGEEGGGEQYNSYYCDDNSSAVGTITDGNDDWASSCTFASPSPAPLLTGEQQQQRSPLSSKQPLPKLDLSQLQIKAANQARPVIAPSSSQAQIIPPFSPAGGSSKGVLKLPNIASPAYEAPVVKTLFTSPTTNHNKYIPEHDYAKALDPKTKHFLDALRDRMSPNASFTNIGPYDQNMNAIPCSLEIDNENTQDLIPITEMSTISTILPGGGLFVEEEQMSITHTNTPQYRIQPLSDPEQAYVYQHSTNSYVPKDYINESSFGLYQRGGTGATATSQNKKKQKKKTASRPNLQALSAIQIANLPLDNEDDDIEATLEDNVDSEDDENDAYFSLRQLEEIANNTTGNEKCDPVIYLPPEFQQQQQQQQHKSFRNNNNAVTVPSSFRVSPDSSSPLKNSASSFLSVPSFAPGTPLKSSNFASSKKLMEDEIAKDREKHLAYIQSRLELTEEDDDGVEEIHRHHNDDDDNEEEGDGEEEEEEEDVHPFTEQSIEEFVNNTNGKRKKATMRSSSPSNQSVSTIGNQSIATTVTATTTATASTGKKSKKNWGKRAATKLKAVQALSGASTLDLRGDIMQFMNRMQTANSSEYEQYVEATYKSPQQLHREETASVTSTSDASSNLNHQVYSTPNHSNTLASNTLYNSQPSKPSMTSFRSQGSSVANSASGQSLTSNQSSFHLQKLQDRLNARYTGDREGQYQTKLKVQKYLKETVKEETQLLRTYMEEIDDWQ